MFRLPLLALVAFLTLASVPPRPAVIRDGPLGDGATLVVTPPLHQVAVAPGQGTTVPLQVHNSSGRALDLTVSAVDAEAADDGTLVATDRRAAVGSWFTVAEDALHLEPGEVAELAPAVNVPDGATGWGAAAVRFRAEGAEVATIVSVDPPGAEARLAATAHLDADPRLADITVRLVNSGQASALVAGRVQVSSWLGRVVVDEHVDAILVGPGATRDLVVAIRPPALPGRYHAAVVFGDGATATRATASAFLWNRLAAATVAALLLGATTWMMVRRVRARANVRRP